MSTSSGKRRIQVTFSETLIERLDAYCAKTGMSRSAFITYVVGANLAQLESLAGVAEKALANRFLEVPFAELDEKGNK